MWNSRKARWHITCLQSWWTLLELLPGCPIITVYPKKYAHGFCFAVLCCGKTLTDFPISIRLTSLALWQFNDCPSASKATLMIMDKYFMWIHYERLHNHNKAKHNKTVCIFLGIYCISSHLLLGRSDKRRFHLRAPAGSPHESHTVIYVRGYGESGPSNDDSWMIFLSCTCYTCLSLYVYVGIFVFNEMLRELNEQH